MRWLWIISWSYLIFVLHSGFARELRIGGCVPHLLLAGLILMTVRTAGSLGTGRLGICLAALWGLLSDCLTDGRLGADVITFVLVAFVIRQMHARWGLTSPARAGVVTAALVAAALVASTSLRLLPDGRIPDLAALGTYAAGSAAYTGFLAALGSLAARIVWREPMGDDAAASPAVSNKWRMLTG
jgi:rod shape-determining protein MreD